MIILPAIPAIVAALAPVAEAVLIGAGTEAAFSGIICGVGNAVSEAQIQQELNKDIAITSIHRGAECAGEGALVGGVFGAVGVITAPVLAPVIQAADDLLRPVGQIVDDFVHWFRQGVDDLLGPIFGRRAPAARSINSVANAPDSNSGWREKCASDTRICQQISVAKGATMQWYDEVSGATKSGITTRHPSIRLAEVSRDVGRPVTYRSIHPGNNLKQVRETERAIHQTFSNQRNVSMPGREWFDLNPIDELSVRAWTP